MSRPPGRPGDSEGNLLTARIVAMRLEGMIESGTEDILRLPRKVAAD